MIKLLVERDRPPTFIWPVIRKLRATLGFQ